VLQTPNKRSHHAAIRARQTSVMQRRRRDVDQAPGSRRAARVTSAKPPAEYGTSTSGVTTVLFIACISAPPVSSRLSNPVAISPRSLHYFTSEYATRRSVRLYCACGFRNRTMAPSCMVALVMPPANPLSAEISLRSGAKSTGASSTSCCRVWRQLLVLPSWSPTLTQGEMMSISAKPPCRSPTLRIGTSCDWSPANERPTNVAPWELQR